MDLKDKLKGFVSKKLSAGAAGVGFAMALESEWPAIVAITYIVVQGVVDGIGAWREAR
jgi:hypothetical protein